MIFPSNLFNKLISTKIWWWKICFDGDLHTSVPKRSAHSTCGDESWTPSGNVWCVRCCGRVKVGAGRGGSVCDVSCVIWEWNDGWSFNGSTSAVLIPSIISPESFNMAEEKGLWLSGFCISADCAEVENSGRCSLLAELVAAFSLFESWSRNSIRASRSSKAFLGLSRLDPTLRFTRG